MSLSYSNIRVCGGILAGGSAVRIGGIAKGLLETGDGKTIIDRLVAQMRLAGVEEFVVSSAEDSPYGRLGFPVVGDIRKRIGPVGGIEAVLNHFDGRCDAVLLMPCDLPYITCGEMSSLLERFIRDNAGVAVPRTAHGHYHPLCAVVRDGLAARVSKAVNDGRRKVMDIWLNSNPSIVDFDDESVFYNINTHADLKNWLARKSGSAGKGSLK